MSCAVPEAGRPHLPFQSPSQRSLVGQQPSHGMYNGTLKALQSHDCPWKIKLGTLLSLVSYKFCRDGILGSRSHRMHSSVAASPPHLRRRHPKARSDRIDGLDWGYTWIIEVCPLLLAFFFFGDQTGSRLRFCKEVNTTDGWKCETVWQYFATLIIKLCAYPPWRRGISQALMSCGASLDQARQFCSLLLVSD